MDTHPGSPVSLPQGKKHDQERVEKKEKQRLYHPRNRMEAI